MKTYSTWLAKLFVFVWAALVYVAGQYFVGVWFEKLSINLCLYSEKPGISYCNWPYFETVGLPLIAAGEIFAIAAVILLFANTKGLRKWAKMSLVYVPLSVCIVAFAPPQEGGIFITTGFSHEFLTWLLGVPYLLATLVIVAWTRFRSEA